MAQFNGPQTITSGLTLCVDAGNQKSYSPNVIPNPTDIFAWCGTAGLNNCTIARDASPTPGPSPVGGTALRMNVTGTDPHIGCYSQLQWNLAPCVANQTWTISVWVAASVATTGELLLAGADSSGNAFGANTWIGGTTVNITTGWTRVSYTATIPGTATASAFIQCRLDGPNSGGVGQTIWWAGLQVERAAAPTAFNAFPNINGTNWFNIVRTTLNGTINNFVTYNTDNSGSLGFNGTNNSVTMANTIPVIGGGDFAIDTWIFLPVVTPTSCWRGIVTIGNGFNTAGGVTLYAPRATAPVNTAVAIVNAVNPTIGGTSNVNDNRWHNIVLTRVGGVLSLYVDGVQEASASNTANITQTAVTIGRDIDCGTTFYQGNIGSLKIYTGQGLSAIDVTQNYEALRSRFGI